MKKLYTPDNPSLGFLPEGIQFLTGDSANDPKVGWVNIRNAANLSYGSLNILSLVSKLNTSFEMPGMPGFFVQTELPGVWIVGITDSLYLVDLTGELPRLKRSRFCISPDLNHMVNDGVETSVGLIFGTKGIPWPAPTGELYFLPRNNPKKLLTVKRGVACSNGIAELGVDGDWLHIAYVDSPLKTLVELAINTNTGTSKEVRQIASFKEASALPDGMRLSPVSSKERSVVVAFFDPENPSYGILREISLDDDKLKSEWRVPSAARVTCPAFVPGEILGGPVGSVMLVATTADEDTPKEQWPNQSNRGCIFIGNTNFSSLNLRNLIPFQTSSFL